MITSPFRLALFIALCAFSAVSNCYTLTQFNFHAGVAAPIGTGIARFTLSAEAMRASQHANYADVGVFNAAGEPVPFSIIKSEMIVANSFVSQVALVPINIQREGASKPSLSDNIMKEIQLDGILIERVRGQPALRVIVAPGNTEAMPKTSSAKVWYFTALGDPEFAAYFSFDVSESERDFAVPVRVEGSDDLRRWSLLAEGTLYRVRVGDRIREVLRIEANGQRTRFVRVTAPGENTFAVGALRGLLVETPQSSQPTPQSGVLSAPLRAGAVAGEWIADLGGRYPLVALQISLPQINTIASAQWATRIGAQEPWNHLVNETVYRILNNGVEIRNPEIVLANTMVREVRIQADMRGGGLGAGEPLLFARYRPVEILFAARGAPPFTLGVGLVSKEVNAQNVPLDSLLPGWSQKQRATIAEVGVDSIRANPKIESVTHTARWRQLNTRTFILWSVLLLAVAALAYMAYRLTRPKLPIERVERT